MAQVRQIANLLELLEYFARTRRPAGLAELSEHFGWPRSSTFNILDTLTTNGFLYEPRPRGGYYPTPRWLSLAQEIVSADPLPEVLLEIVQRCAEATGETAWIAVPGGQFAVFLHVVNSVHAVRYMAETGHRVPIHATATGEALLSQMSDAQRDALLRRAEYVRYSRGAPGSAEEVRARIRRGQERGWFESASNYSNDLGGITLPIAMNGRIFALTVAGPLFRVGDKTAQIADLMRGIVAEALGAPAP